MLIEYFAFYKGLILLTTTFRDQILILDKSDIMGRVVKELFHQYRSCLTSVSFSSLIFKCF